MCNENGLFCDCCKKSLVNNQKKYCSRKCANKSFGESRKGVLWSDEKKSKLSKKMKEINSSGEVSDKRKKTCNLKYGGNSPSSSNIIKDKIKKTNLEKYGVENPIKNDNVKLKQKNTFIERYGGYTLSSEILSKKVKKTNNEIYNSDNVFGNEDIKDKIKKTNLEKYGVENPMQSVVIQDKAKSTNIKKYGVANPMQSEKILEKIRNNNLRNCGTTGSTNRHLKIIWEKLNSIEWWNQFNNTSDIKNELIDYLSISGIEKYIHKFRPELIGINLISSPHQLIINLLNKFNIEFIINDRTQIKPLELDIYIPKFKLAIEINGLYWHSEISGNKKSTYHINKRNRCNDIGIQLLQFWDSELFNNYDIIESMIKSKLNLNDKLYARKCNIKINNINIDDKRDFLNNNHLQGYINSSYDIGLYYENELVSIMTFGKPRFNKKCDCELLRYCNKIGYNIVGGASKMFVCRPTKSNIITYSDMRYSNGDIYNTLGFSKITQSKPSYFYTFDYLNIYNRINFQKHKLNNLLENYDSNLNEWINMQNNGYDRIWDCGNMVFEFKT